MLEYIDPAGMRVWSRVDRLGSRLRHELDEGAVPDRLYKLDVEIWHPGDMQLAERLLRELAAVLYGAAGERIFDQFVGRDICLLRIGVLGRNLDRLLDLSIVADVELPPIPHFDPVQVAQATRDQFVAPPRPEEDGPRVCILDSGISANHPLLRANVGHIASILTDTEDAADQHGHGTMVAGLAVFGDVRTCYETGTFESPIQVFSARVLNDLLRFDDERLIINQIREAVLTFYRPPHGCRIFNLSLGTGSPALADGNERQPVWAESLDVLARELKVLFVVSAGNNGSVFVHDTEQAEAVLNGFPGSLFEPSARLDDPATSALSVTVGSLAESDDVAVRQGIGKDDIARAISPPDCPSPFTRTGPGVSRALKPEFADYGGNLEFRGWGQVRRIAQGAASATMSLSHNPLQNLFRFDVGTSFSAPRVARKAALAWHALRNALGQTPDPNLVRALLAAAASVPERVREILAPLPEPEDKIARTCGYGLVDLDFVMDSADRRVCLVAQGTLELDRFLVYEIPIPPEFRSAPGAKTVSVSLAFDPPVRRRRAEYLGVEMSFRLIRGRSLEEVVTAYRHLAPDEEPERAIKGKFLVKLKPLENSRSMAGVRKKSTLQKASCTFQRLDDYGETYHLVVRAERKWAPADVQRQDFGVVVTVAAEEPRLYHLLQQRLRAGVRIRARR